MVPSMISAARMSFCLSGARASYSSRAASTLRSGAFIDKLPYRRERLSVLHRRTSAVSLRCLNG